MIFDFFLIIELFWNFWWVFMDFDAIHNVDSRYQCHEEEPGDQEPLLRKANGQQQEHRRENDRCIEAHIHDQNHVADWI